MADRHAVTDPMPDEKSDTSDAVVERARQGAADAIGMLYDQHHDPVFRFLWARVGERHTAEDLTGEVFLRMQSALPRYESRRQPFRAWLFRIARNLVVDRYRQHKGRQELPLDEAGVAPPGEADPEETVERKLTAEHLRRALLTINPARREVVALRFFGQLSVRETAMAVGKTEAAVKALQHEGLLELRSALRQE